MSLQAEDGYPIPEETRRIARAAFPKGTLCQEAPLPSLPTG
jgi:hypothetical protein